MDVTPSVSQEKAEPKAPEKERTAVKISGLKKTTRIPDLTTIKQNISNKQSEKQDDHLKIGMDPVSVDQLKKEWHAFAEKLKSDGRDREYNTLNQEVEFHDDLSIRLMLPNSFQSLTIEGLQQELLTYLRTKLNNNSIQLITEIEKVENKKLIYTNSEKFDYLAEKYPNLRDLKKRLDLDTDF